MYDTAGVLRRVCAQLERGLVGLCSCVFDADRVLALPYEVKWCVRARLVRCMVGRLCECAGCTAFKEFCDLLRLHFKERQRAQYRRNEVCI